MLTTPEFYWVPQTKTRCPLDQATISRTVVAVISSLLLVIGRWLEILTPSSVLELNDMSKAEARQLLARRVPKQALLDDKTTVDELLAILTYLPLTIVQAAAFLNNNDISVSS
jgi:hypothetical protein